MTRMTMLVKNALLNGNKTDLYINGNIISKISKSIDCRADNVLDAAGKAVLPGLLNGHTHAAMTLFRGYGDDMELFEWLNNKIWPVEAKMTEEDVYWGAKLACLEMIKSGTTFFQDMYWHWPGTVRAVSEMGLRASLAGILIDFFDDKKARIQQNEIRTQFDMSRQYPDRIAFSLGPHAIYSVSVESLQWAKDFADTYDLKCQIHLSETEKEVNDCIQKHGLRPVEYLEEIKCLGPNISLAHAIWLNDNEIEILNSYSVGVVTNPCANMKLSTGVFPFSSFHNGGVTIGIGTDGVASNNNYDLFEEMKIAALLEKSRTGDPTSAPADEIFKCVTRNNAEIFSINCGILEEGTLADLILVDLQTPSLIPGHCLTSDLVYSANGAVVDTVICDGRVLMKDRYVEGEEEIIARGREVALDLMKR